MIYTFYYADDGTPKEGLSPTLDIYVKVSDGTSAGAPPAVTELSGGFYKFTAVPAEAIACRIDSNDAAMADVDRYISIRIAPEDANLDAAITTRATPAQVATALTDIQLDHLMAVACDGDILDNAVVDKSVAAFMFAYNADISRHNPTTDNLDQIYYNANYGAGKALDAERAANESLMNMSLTLPGIQGFNKPTITSGTLRYLANSNLKWAQRFKQIKDGVLSKAMIRVIRQSNPTGNLWVELHADNAGVPADPILAQSNNFDLEKLGTNPTENSIQFDFPTLPELSADTEYHIVLNADNVMDGAKYPKVMLATCENPYKEKTYRYTTAGGWIENAQSLCFAVTAPSASASAADMKRLLGLVHENAYADNQQYDGDNNLTSARLRIYDSKTNADAHGAAGLVETYLLTAAYAGQNVMTNYKMVRDE